MLCHETCERESRAEPEGTAESRCVCAHCEQVPVLDSEAEACPRTATTAIARALNGHFACPSLGQPAKKASRVPSRLQIARVRVTGEHGCLHLYPPPVNHGAQEVALATTMPTKGVAASRAEARDLKEDAELREPVVGEPPRVAQRARCPRPRREDVDALPHVKAPCRFAMKPGSTWREAGQEGCKAVALAARQHPPPLVKQTEQQIRAVLAVERLRQA